MNKTLLSVAMILAVLLLPREARGDSWTLTLLPGGDISGPQGSTIGWGFTIDNMSSETLMLTNLSADVFQFATPNAGLFSYPLVDPNSTLTVDYLAGTSGLYELAWDPTAPIGFVNSGSFVVSAAWCDSTLATCTAAPDQSASYSATVTAPNSIPEPGTFLLYCTGLAAVFLKRIMPA